MLVKRSIVERWYQRDSWVYKHFSYLFENPLWTGHVPQGFSVCPYFWLSLFSFLIFRPLFVAPVTYILKPIIKLFGKPMGALDNWLSKIGSKTPLSVNWDVTGVGIAFGILVLMSGVVIGLLLFALGISVIEIYTQLNGHTLGLFSLWSGLSFATLWAIIGSHKIITKTECKTANYLWVWLGLFIIAAGIFIPGEIVTGITNGFHSTIHAISASVAWLWSVLVWMGINFWAGLKIGLSWKPIAVLLLPWWGYLLFITGFGWMADKISNSISKRNLDALREYSTEKYEKKCRQAWLNLLVKVMTFDGNDKLIKREIRDNQLLYLPKYSIQCSQTILSWNLHWLVQAMLEILLKDKLDELQKTYPLVEKIHWGNLKARDYVEAMHQLEKELGITLDFTHGHIHNAFLQLYELRPDIQRKFEAQCQLWQAQNDKLVLKRTTAKESWSHQMCLKVTSAIGNTVSSFFKKVWRGLSAAYHQLAIFCAYLWVLIKAKKQGACPYIRFTDPGENDDEKSA